MRERDKIRINQEPDLNATMAFTPSEYGTPLRPKRRCPPKNNFDQIDKSGQTVDEFLRKKLKRMKTYEQRLKEKLPLFDEPPKLNEKGV